MWISLSNSFLSIVQPLSQKTPPEHRNQDVLLVRARREGDIEKTFPDATVIVGAGTDYLYRAYIDRVLVAKNIMEKVILLDYDNFKNSVEDDDLHNAYLNVWHDMNALQRRDNVNHGYQGTLGAMFEDPEVDRL